MAFYSDFTASPYRNEFLQREWLVTISTESSVGQGYAQALSIAGSGSDLVAYDYGDTGGLHFSFEVTKDLTGEPNKCKLTIYNLSEEVRDQLDGISIFDPKKPKGTKQKQGTKRKPGTPRAPKTGLIRVEIEAGYKETGRALIFRGDLRHASSEMQDDKSWKTEIEGEDGGVSYLTSRITASYGPGTSLLTGVRACYEAMGLGKGNIHEVEHLLSKTYPRGAVLDGPASRELAGILRRAKVSYSIRDGELHFRPLTGSQDRTKAAVLDAFSGMIGSPVRKNTGLVQVTTLINPQVVVGGYVQVASNVLTGTYEVHKIECRGSNFGDEWYQECELKATQGFDCPNVHTGAGWLSIVIFGHERK